MKQRVRLCLAALMLSGLTGLFGPQALLHAESELPTDFRNGADLYRRGKHHYECQSAWERFWRAGNPHCTSRWARPNYDGFDHGYYVGGGAVPRGRFGGENRYCTNTEGTWGWDYCPPWSRVRLFWWHGRKQQGSGGQFEPNHNNKPFSEEFRAPAQE